jgi:hypothetical protein
MIECSNACSNEVWTKADFAEVRVRPQASDLMKRETRGRQLAMRRTPLQKKSSRRASRPSPIRDSNSLGGTIKPQGRGLFGSSSGLKSGDDSCPPKGHAEDKTAAQRPFRPPCVAQKFPVLRIGVRYRLVARLVAHIHGEYLGCAPTRERRRVGSGSASGSGIRETAAVGN